MERRQLLCPVLWVSPKGLLLVMATAKPVNPSEFDLTTYANLVMSHWDPMPGEMGNHLNRSPTTGECMAGGLSPWTIQR